MEKYEYLTKKTGVAAEVNSNSTRNGSPAELKYLNEMGEQGWQLCYVAKDPLGNIYYFKRCVGKI